MEITPKTFTIPAKLIGSITPTTIAEHLKLYQGYVANANTVLTKKQEYMKDPAMNTYEISELNRRLSFEYNGITNHELYFEQIEGGPSAIDTSSALYAKIVDQWGSWDAWIADFVQTAKTRGIGWAMLYYDSERDFFINSWVDEQHIGHLGSLHCIYALDMWEHSYVLDYLPSGKASYIQDYMSNTNWNIPQERYNAITHQG